MPFANAIALSPRLVPSGTYLWAEWRGTKAIITDVRAGSAAERAGLRSGMRVISLQGRPIEAAIQERLPHTLRAPDPAARDWALRVVLADRHDRPVRLVAETPGGGRREFEFTPGIYRPDTPLSGRVFDDMGYIRIHNSLGDMALIGAFDSTLARTWPRGGGNPT